MKIKSLVTMSILVKMREAHREFRAAMRTAMLKADPSVRPILDELPRAGKADE